jgi:Mg2+ and Co2+ transporter CorA
MDIGELKGRIKLDNSQFKKSIKEATGGFSDFQKKTIALNQGLNVAKTAVAAFAQASKVAFREIERGAARIDVENIFGNLAENAGREAEEMLKALKEASKGALTEMQAMTAANQALISGMDFSAVTTSIEYLQKYAKATNKDFQQLTNTIMTGLVRGSVQLLDDAGIIIDQTTLMAEATKKYGRALTEVEKKQVLVNAAIEQMKQKMPALGGNVRTLSDDLMSIKASMQDFHDVIAKAAVRAYGVMMTSWHGLKLMPVEIEALFQKLKIAFAKNLGELASMVLKYMMEIIATIRDSWSDTLAGLAGQGGVFVTQYKKALEAGIYAADVGINALWNANDKIIFAETDANKRLAELYRKRAAIIKSGAKYFNMARVKFATGGTIPKVNFGGAGGDIAADPKDAIKALQQQIGQLKFDRQTLGMDSFNRALAEANYNADQLSETYADFKNNEQIQAMIEQVRDLEVANLNAAKSWKAQQEGIKAFADNLQDGLSTMEGPLSQFFEKLAKTGEASLKELVHNLVETLQVYAAQKTAHLLLEGLFHSAMTIIDPYGDHSTKAATAYQGAALMGSFVAGSALAGMAHSGITSIPEDGTWLLKKNERVVDSETNKDLKKFIANGGQTVNIEQNIEINGGDEEGVMNAIPRIQEAVVEIVTGDITSNGQIIKSIRHSY